MNIITNKTTVAIQSQEFSHQNYDVSDNVTLLLAH